MYLRALDLSVTVMKPLLLPGVIEGTRRLELSGPGRADLS